MPLTARTTVGICTGFVRGRRSGTLMAVLAGGSSALEISMVGADINDLSEFVLGQNAFHLEWFTCSDGQNVIRRAERFDGQRWNTFRVELEDIAGAFMPEYFPDLNTYERELQRLRPRIPANPTRYLCTITRHRRSARSVDLRVSAEYVGDQFADVITFGGTDPLPEVGQTGVLTYVHYPVNTALSWQVPGQPTLVYPTPAGVEVTELYGGNYPNINAITRFLEGKNPFRKKKGTIPKIIQAELEDALTDIRTAKTPKELQAAYKLLGDIIGMKDTNPVVPAATTIGRITPIPANGFSWTGELRMAEPYGVSIVDAPR